MVLIFFIMHVHFLPHLKSVLVTYVFLANFVYIIWILKGVGLKLCTVFCMWFSNFLPFLLSVFLFFPAFMRYNRSLLCFLVFLKCSLRFILIRSAGVFLWFGREILLPNIEKFELKSIFLSSLFYWGIILNQYVNFRYVTQRFGISRHYQMITTEGLVNTCHHTEL